MDKSSSGFHTRTAWVSSAFSSRLSEGREGGRAPAPDVSGRARGCGERSPAPSPPCCPVIVPGLGAFGLRLLRLILLLLLLLLLLLFVWLL